MLSGIWPRGNSSAPGSGNTGITSGRSAGPRYSALIGMNLPAFSYLTRTATLGPRGDRRYRRLRHDRPPLREQDRRQPLASVDRRLVGAAPCLEQLHQLPARAVVVPLAIAPDDLEQLGRGLGAFALRVQRGGEVEPRLMIERVCGDFLFKLADRAD